MIDGKYGPTTLDTINFCTLFEELGKESYEGTAVFGVSEDKKQNPNGSLQAAPLCHSYISKSGKRNLVFFPTDLGKKHTYLSLSEALQKVFDHFKDKLLNMPTNFLIPLVIGDHWVTVQLSFEPDNSSPPKPKLMFARLYDSSSSWFKWLSYRQVNRCIHDFVSSTTGLAPVPLEVVNCKHQRDFFSCGAWTNLYIRKIIEGFPPSPNDKLVIDEDRKWQLARHKDYRGSEPDNRISTSFLQQHKKILIVGTSILLGLGIFFSVFFTGGATSPLLFWLGLNFLKSLSLLQVSVIAGAAVSIIAGFVFTAATWICSCGSTEKSKIVGIGKRGLGDDSCAVIGDSVDKHPDQSFVRVNEKPAQEESEFGTHRKSSSFFAEGQKSDSDKKDGGADEQRDEFTNGCSQN